MTNFSNILKSVISGILAFVVSYVTLGPIMQPATLVSHSTPPAVATVPANVTATASQPS